MPTFQIQALHFHLLPMYTQFKSLCGCPWKDVEIDDKEVFGWQWWAWWLSLQLDSWKCDDKPSTDMDWLKLQKPGKNGFLLIMLELVWGEWHAIRTGNG